MFGNIFILSAYLLLLCCVQFTTEEDVFACQSKVYCHGPLLDVVQRAGLFPDSKTFVDMALRNSPEETLREFAALQRSKRNLTRDDIKQFVEVHFSGPGEEFQPWTPPDHKNLPAFLNKLTDPLVRDFGWNLCRIWKDLGRKIKDDVNLHPDRYSLIYLPHPFIIPGGRFRETYYWDSYWVLRGLLVCGMNVTAKGMLDNFVHYIDRFGFIPNGGRIYQSLRSQPPLFIPMVYDYYTRSHQTAVLRHFVPYMEREYNFWIGNRSVEVTRNGKSFTVQRYATPLNNPRPESYIEDIQTAQYTDVDLRPELYSHIASATETGMGFSSRWFSRVDDSLTLNTTVTKLIVPVDLNSILCMNERLLAEMFKILGDREKSLFYTTRFQQRKSVMEDLFWNKGRGFWQDFSLITNKTRDYFFPSNIFPLFSGCVDNEEEKMEEVLKYLQANKILDFDGGVPASLINTGQQWDFPNGWPPIQHAYIWTLVNSANARARSKGRDLAKKWFESNWKSWNRSRVVFEKYSVADPGRRGGGGEYNVQEGFGWTNGVLLDIIQRFGEDLQLYKPQKEKPACFRASSANSPGHNLFSVILLFVCFLRMKAII